MVETLNREILKFLGAFALCRKETPRKIQRLSTFRLSKQTKMKLLLQTNFQTAGHTSSLRLSGH